VEGLVQRPKRRCRSLWCLLRRDGRLGYVQGYLDPWLVAGFRTNETNKKSPTESNAHSFAVTPHPCKNNAYHVCENDGCGGTYSENRFNGDCDPNGCDYNPYRQGNKDFYGAGKTLDTTKVFT
jgi:hypothetical protein